MLSQQPDNLLTVVAIHHHHHHHRSPASLQKHVGCKEKAILQHTVEKKKQSNNTHSENIYHFSPAEQRYQYLCPLFPLNVEAACGSDSCESLTSMYVCSHSVCPRAHLGAVDSSLLLRQCYVQYLDSTRSHIPSWACYSRIRGPLLHRGGEGREAEGGGVAEIKWQGDYEGISLWLDISALGPLCLTGRALLTELSPDSRMSGRLFLSLSWSVTQVWLSLSKKHVSISSPDGFITLHIHHYGCDNKAVNALLPSLWLCKFNTIGLLPKEITMFIIVQPD